MKLGSRDNFRQFLHVHRLDVNNIWTTLNRDHGDQQSDAEESRKTKRTEALVTDVQVPQIDSRIINGDIRLLV
jgi:hypothetical protein